MACWVVPSLAAEYWGIPVSQVLEKIRTGEIATKSELGFMLVDVAPSSPTVGSGRKPKVLRPTTFVMAPATAVLTMAEKRALAGDLPTEATEPALAESEDSTDEERLDWRATRLAVSRQRRAPRAAGLAA